ncbi:MAG: hypothetical protein KDI29_12010 [Pseudomonadales bacterium]|nr:hypothetical protein [Pseudomonadales bacterium]
MKTSNPQDSLDSRLARIAQVADAGFSQRVEHELRKLSNVRTRIFVGAGLCWLVLALLFRSAPDAGMLQFLTVDDFTTLRQALIQQFGALLPFLPSPGTLLMLTLALTAAAVGSILVRD